MLREKANDNLGRSHGWSLPLQRPRPRPVGRGFVRFSERPTPRRGTAPGRLCRPEGCRYGPSSL